MEFKAIAVWGKEGELDLGAEKYPPILGLHIVYKSPFACLLFLADNGIEP